MGDGILDTVNAVEEEVNIVLGMETNLHYL